MNYFSYYSEIEEHFVRRRRKNLLISPLDWALIQTWKEMDIPLHIVLRGIDRAFDQFEAKPKTRLVNSLFYCQQSVQESFEEYVQSRVGETPQEQSTRPLVERQESEELLERFSREVFQAHTRAQELGMMELAGVFERALVRLNDLKASLPPEGDIDIDGLEKDLQVLDTAVTESIQKAVGEDVGKLWLDDAKKDLKPYKKRVPKEMFEKILQNYLRKRARQEFAVSLFSLFSV